MPDKKHPAPTTTESRTQGVTISLGGKEVVLNSATLDGLTVQHATVTKESGADKEIEYKISDEKKGHEIALTENHVAKRGCLEVKRDGEMPAKLTFPLERPFHQIYAKTDGMKKLVDQVLEDGKLTVSEVGQIRELLKSPVTPKPKNPAPSASVPRKP